MLRAQFTLDGSVPVAQWFFDQAYLGAKAETSEWSAELVNNFIHRIQTRDAIGNYDNTPLYEFFDANAHLVRGRRGLVVGSENPWLEAMLIHFGALHVTTLEFGAIHSLHPQIDTWTPASFTHSFLQGQVEPFDFAFSYSSLEHDGLGRYGDVLNPIGDLQTMARLRHIVKPGGMVMVGVPCCYDELVWNAHRVYGPLRMPLLFAGYQLVAVHPSQVDFGNAGVPFSQPVWVLRNRINCDGPEPTSTFATTSEAGVL